jgi:hypothetical protein
MKIVTLSLNQSTIYCILLISLAKFFLYFSLLLKHSKWRSGNYYIITITGIC